jgi:hypothetical protein
MLIPVYSNKSIHTLICSVKKQPLIQAVMHNGNYLTEYLKKRDNSVGIATMLTAESRVQFPDEVRAFSLFHSVQTGSGAHPNSYPMGTLGYSRRGR